MDTTTRALVLTNQTQEQASIDMQLKINTTGLVSRLSRLVTVTIITALLSSIAFAKSSYLPLVPLPSIPDYTKGDGWTNSFGLQLGTSAIYKGSDHYELSVKPEGAIQYRNGDYLFFWEGFDFNSTEAGWRGLVTDNWLIKIGARHEIVIPSTRSEKTGIDGLPHRGSHILARIDMKYSIGYEWKNWISCQLLGGPSSYGWQTKLAAGHLFRQGLGNNGTEIQLYTTFADRNNFNDYFGVSETDSDTTNLNPIELEGGYRSTGLDIFYRRGIGRHTHLLVRAGIEVFSNEIEESDLVLDRSPTYINAALVWGK